MKKLFFLLVLLLCHYYVNAQGNLPTSDSVVKYLKGSWRLHKYSGGIAGTTSTSSSPGWVNAYVIFNTIAGATDSITYSYYSGGTLSNSGSSKIIQFAGVNPVWYFGFNKLPASSLKFYVYIFDAKKDSLRVSDYMISDGYIYSYVRDNTLGITKNEIKSGICIYPNPVENQISLNGIESLAEIDAIFDMSGNIFEPVLKEPGALDVSHLNPGIYFIKRRNSNSVEFIRFLKQ